MKQILLLLGLLTIGYHGGDTNMLYAQNPYTGIMKSHTPPGSENVVMCDITTEQPGELQDRLPYYVSIIGRLTVQGPINSVDFETLWFISTHSSLWELFLENAVAVDDVVPDYAFYHPEEQYDSSTGVFKSIYIYELTLPSNVVEIGKFAFANAKNLESVGLPAGLKRIGSGAFLNCRNLSLDSIALPDGLEEIGDNAFKDCYSLTGTTTLPNSVKSIGSGAFSLTGIDLSSFPENLEYLGKEAFAGGSLSEVVLPDGCELDKGGWQFAGNRQLKSVHLPDNLTDIPEAILKNCVELVEVNIPEKVRIIWPEAFAGCTSLEKVTLPYGIKVLDLASFRDCRNLRELVLPASLESIGYYCFVGCQGVESITCKAKYPPSLHTVPDIFPVFEGIDRNIPVYIPVGTKEKYLSEFGWDYFHNFIETDFSGVECVEADMPDADGPVYDIMGRQVTHPVDNHLYIGQGKKFIYSSVK